LELLPTAAVDHFDHLIDFLELNLMDTHELLLRGFTSGSKDQFMF
jgi:hypothetical protein